MENKIGICTIATIPVRSESREASEMCTQLLFGEQYEVIKELERWLKIRCLYDNYEGYIDRKLFVEADVRKTTTFVEEPLVWLEDTNSSVRFVVGTGCELGDVDRLKNCFKIGEKHYQILGEPLRQGTALKNLVRSYLMTPYLWGGRSTFGIDCSGLSQVVYKLQGIQLPRDASQQVKVGEELENRGEAKLGDLAFFESENGRITHVGIMISPDKIIHASGFVREDWIDDEGIYQNSGEKHTHKLHSIRRYTN